MSGNARPKQSQPPPPTHLHEPWRGGGQSPPLSNPGDAATDPRNAANVINRKTLLLETPRSRGLRSVRTPPARDWREGDGEQDGEGLEHFFEVARGQESEEIL